MNVFHLPDLGEGLPNAEIHEWLVKEGDIVSAYQPLVSMETAKALVDVPSPQDGKIIKLHGKSGDLINTGEPLVSFENLISLKSTDEGTVVGKLDNNLLNKLENQTDNFIIYDNQSYHPKSTPRVKLLAKKYNIDLTQIQPSGEYNLITEQDLNLEKTSNHNININNDGFIALKGVQRAMQINMVQSHKNVVPVTIFDEVDINSWSKNSENSDITIRLIRAIVTACKAEPSLNAWFDNKKNAIKKFDQVNIGLAMDSPEGLFVPVIMDVDSINNHDLRQNINKYKLDLSNRSIKSENLKNATITLSNFGKFSGRFASPIVIPPTVAILAVGKCYLAPVVTNNGTIEAHKLLPLSLSFDHRAITGGEATRFLGMIIKSIMIE